MDLKMYYILILFVTFGLGDTLDTETDDGNDELVPLLIDGSSFKDETIANPDFVHQFSKSRNPNPVNRQSELNVETLPERVTMNLNIYESSSWITGTRVKSHLTFT